jgi:hypothetical protein
VSKLNGPAAHQNPQPCYLQRIPPSFAGLDIEIFLSDDREDTLVELDSNCKMAKREDTCDGCEDIQDLAHIQRGFSSGRTGVSSGLTPERNYRQLRCLYDESEAVHGLRVLMFT